MAYGDSIRKDPSDLGVYIPSVISDQSLPLPLDFKLQEGREQSCPVQLLYIPHIQSQVWHIEMSNRLIHLLNELMN